MLIGFAKRFPAEFKENMVFDITLASPPTDNLVPAMAIVEGLMMLIGW